MNMDPSRGNLPTSELPEAHQYRQDIALDQIMKASKLFDGLKTQEIAEIRARLQPVNCQQGEHILERGIWHGRLYIIGSGQVSVLLQEGAPRGGEEGTAFVGGRDESRPYVGEQTGPGQDSGQRERSGAQSYIISQLGPGECFGEMSLITGDLPSATVRAERD